MTKRLFEATFKAKVVLEIISGEKSIDQAANDYQLSPNLIRNWRKEFKQNAQRAFENNNNPADPDIETLLSKINQLTIQVEWLKKKSEEIFGSQWEDIFAPKP